MNDYAKRIKDACRDLNTVAKNMQECLKKEKASIDQWIVEVSRMMPQMQEVFKPYDKVSNASAKLELDFFESKWEKSPFVWSDLTIRISSSYGIKEHPDGPFMESVRYGKPKYPDAIHKQMERLMAQCKERLEWYMSMFESAPSLSTKLHHRLSNHAVKVLQSHGINNMDDLWDYTEKDRKGTYWAQTRAIRGLGDKTLNEIKAVLWVEEKYRSRNN